MNLHWILFDLGGVLYDIDVQQPIQMLKSLSRADLDGQTEDFLYQEHVQFMKGKYSPEEFFARLKNTLNISLGIEEIQQIWDKIILNFRNEFKPVLAGLKLHYNLALVSNTDPSHIKKILAQVPEFPYFFNRIFLSYEMKKVKPSHEFFITVLKEIQADPAQCLFLDDSEENVEAAQLVGIHGERVTSYSDVIAVFKYYGIQTNF
ncbi:MAG: HAD family phosphatase [Calditrichaeota bacterium]|nr:MAG: HAD family phosphatase [Calditrichota bacterium]